MSSESKRPEDEAPEAETVAASETSGDTPAESAAAAPADTGASTPAATDDDAVGADAAAEDAAATGDKPTEPADATDDGPTEPADATEDGPAEPADATGDGPTEPADATGDGPTEDDQQDASADQAEGADDADAPAPADAAADDEAAAVAQPQRRRDRPRTPGEAVIVRAQAKYVRSSARKARLVCDNIRGKSVAEAKSILAFHPRQVALAWEKVLDSAVANAENNHELDAEDLKILAIYADEGPTIKRFRPRSHGRATPIRKRTAHLSIQLTTKD